MFAGAIKKFGKSLRQRGIWGTALVSSRRVYRTLRNLNPARRRANEAYWAAEHSFDLRHNIDTAGWVSLTELAQDQIRWQGWRYQPIKPDWFHEMMQAAGEVAADRVFVDFGCGKGRAIFLASQYPFRRIVGVELFPPLVEIARKNLANYQNALQVCGDLQVVLSDAVLYSLPEDPLVLFFYNPFGDEIMAKVLDNVRRSLERHCRPITVLYYAPKNDHLCAMLPLLRKAVSVRDYSIYHAGAEQRTR